MPQQSGYRGDYFLAFTERVKDGTPSDVFIYNNALFWGCRGHVGRDAVAGGAGGGCILG